MEQILAVKREGYGEGILPSSPEWEKAPPISFSSDWQGANSDPLRETQVRMLWSYDHLYIRFHCRYRGLYVYEDTNNRRDELWLRDVAEVFIQTGADSPGNYKEFEISPNGDWLDLTISPGAKTHLFCDLKSRVRIDSDSHCWTAEMAIPIHCLTAKLNPQEIWRLNLFRIEGLEPYRFYSAWRPTGTPVPNFHVPECFGELHFCDDVQ